MHCGAKLETGDKFCPGCGAAFLPPRGPLPSELAQPGRDLRSVIAILAIVALLGAVAFFGSALYVTRPTTMEVQRCILPGALRCEDASLAQHSATLILENRVKEALVLERAEIVGCSPWEGNTELAPGQQEKLTFWECALGSLGQNARTSLRITFLLDGTRFEQEGQVAGIVQSESPRLTKELPTILKESTCKPLGDALCMEKTIRTTSVVIIMTNVALEEVTLQKVLLSGCPELNLEHELLPGEQAGILFRDCRLGQLGEAIRKDLSVEFLQGSELRDSKGEITGVVQSAYIRLSADDQNRDGVPDKIIQTEKET